MGAKRPTRGITASAQYKSQQKALSHDKVTRMLVGPPIECNVRVCRKGEGTFELLYVKKAPFIRL